MIKGDEWFLVGLKKGLLIKSPILTSPREGLMPNNIWIKRIFVFTGTILF